MKNMKKIITILLLGICIISFGTCIGISYVFDETLPKEESVILNVQAGTVDIVEYNGIKVDWKFGSVLKKIKIPGGKTRFILKGSQASGRTTTAGNATFQDTTIFVYDNVPFEYVFENGKEYTMWINNEFILIFNDLPPLMTSKYILHSYDMSKGQKLVAENGKTL